METMKTTPTSITGGDSLSPSGTRVKPWNPWPMPLAKHRTEMVRKNLRVVKHGETIDSTCFHHPCQNGRVFALDKFNCWISTTFSQVSHLVQRSSYPMSRRCLTAVRFGKQLSSMYHSSVWRWSIGQRHAGSLEVWCGQTSRS